MYHSLVHFIQVRVKNFKAMNVQQVLFIFFTTAFYLIVIISSAKKPMHLKRNITKAANAYNLSSRYFGNNRTLRKNFTSRYCFLKEKVESTCTYF